MFVRVCYFGAFCCGCLVGVCFAFVSSFALGRFLIVVFICVVCLCELLFDVELVRVAVLLLWLFAFSLYDVWLNLACLGWYYFCC